MKKLTLLTLLLASVATAQQLPVLPNGAPSGTVTNGGINLTSGRVVLATGTSTVGTDAGLTYTGTGATFSLQLGGTGLGLSRALAGVLSVDGATAGDASGITHAFAGRYKAFVGIEEVPGVSDYAIALERVKPVLGIPSAMVASNGLIGFSGGSATSVPSAFFTQPSPGVISVDTTAVGDGLGTVKAAHFTGSVLSTSPTAVTSTVPVVVPDLSFSGTTTTGLHPKSLTTAQRDAVSPIAVAGDLIYNSTTQRVEVYDGAAWHGRVRLDGDTMTGALTTTGLISPTLSAGAAAAGTDQAGGDETISAKQGTGAGTAGKVVIQAPTKQATGAGVQPLVTVATFQDSGTGGTSRPQVLLADGLAAAPSLGFANYTQHGLFALPASVSVSISGTEVARIGTKLTMLTDAGSLAIGVNSDTILTRGGAAATWQLGAANATSPVAQTLTFQSTTANDTAGATATIKGSQGKGTGSGGAIQVQTGITGGSAATANNVQTRYYVAPAPKALTLGSATNFVRVDFPASSTVTVAVGYNITFSDAATPPEFKANGGRYYVSCYRKATGNAACGTVVETGDSSVNSVGGAPTDTMTATGDANGVILAQNAAFGTGGTGSPVGTMTFDIHAHGSSTITVTPQ